MTKLDLTPVHGLGRGEVAAPLNDTMIVRSRIARLTSPPNGRASVGVGSHAFSALPLSMATNEPAPGETTPSELLAAAHGSALAVILARTLEDSGAAARELVIETTYELRGDWYELDRIAFDVQARLSDGADPPLDQLVDGPELSDAVVGCLRARDGSRGSHAWLPYMARLSIGVSRAAQS